MCGSWPEGYRDHTDAERAMQRVAELLGDSWHNLKTIGPGPKPEVPQ